MFDPTPHATSCPTRCCGRPSGEACSARCRWPRSPPCSRWSSASRSPSPAPRAAPGSACPPRCILEFFRGMPVLLMMLFILLVFSVGSFWAGVAALAVYNGAIIGEALRAGIESLPRGQREARAGHRAHPRADPDADRVPAGVPADAADHHRPAGRAAEGHLAGLRRRLRGAARARSRTCRTSTATATCSPCSRSAW